MDLVVEVFKNIMLPQTMLLVVIGTVVGVIMGAMPGLNGAIGVALLLPFTFNLPPEAGLLMLGGIYMGGSYGGAITAILLNAPGTIFAACTAIEGYPMSKQGRAKEALYYSIYACVFGGLIGVIALIFFTPLLAKVALKFGPPEMFVLAISGLTVVGSLGDRKKTYAYIAACLGLLLSTVGTDPATAAYRFTFGIRQLKAGTSLIPVILGLFAMSEMLKNLGTKEDYILSKAEQNITRFEALTKTVKHYKTLIKSSIMGTLIGILPGAGGAVATFIAYAEAKRNSKKPELFGKGNPEGILASESANNAVVGGSLVPLLALGIPGSAISAMMLGALTIHGVIPGPNLFVIRPTLAYTFMYGMLLTIVVMAVIGIFGIKYFSLILRVKNAYIIPAVLIFCIFGAYSINNSMFDVLITICFGALGLLFKKINIPIPPIILGLILGPIIELNLRRSMDMAFAVDKNIVHFLMGRPIVVLLLLLTLLFTYSFSSKEKKSKILV